MTHYDGSASTEFAKLDTTGTGFVGSLEGGYPISLPALGSGFVLEPQAQIVWQHVLVATPTTVSARSRSARRQAARHRRRGNDDRSTQQAGLGALCACQSVA